MAAQERAASRRLVMAGTDGGRDVNPGCRKRFQALEMVSHFVGGSMDLVGQQCTAQGWREWESIQCVPLSMRRPCRMDKMLDGQELHSLLLGIGLLLLKQGSQPPPAWGRGGPR